MSACDKQAKAKAKAKESGCAALLVSYQDHLLYFGRIRSAADPASRMRCVDSVANSQQLFHTCIRSTSIVITTARIPGE